MTMSEMKILFLSFHTYYSSNIMTAAFLVCDFLIEQLKHITPEIQWLFHWKRIFELPAQFGCAKHRKFRYVFWYAYLFSYFEWNSNYQLYTSYKLPAQPDEINHRKSRYVVIIAYSNYLNRMQITNAPVLRDHLWDNDKLAV